MYSYNEADRERRIPEDEKGSRLSEKIPHGEEHRDVFSRDRARVLHSAALRRLADKTQVVGPGEGDTPRTRLTHSLEVAQISRGIGVGLGLNGDLCEMAGLTHDIGHPPYGHNGETALNELAADFGGFEGNAQTLRILTRLEPKVLTPTGESYGLNLSRAALDAACKYPRTATNPDGSRNKKYSCYDEDAAIFAWIRQGRPVGDERPCMEAQVMDFSDDIAYSVHDVEDGIAAGRIRLSVLGDLVELAELAAKGVQAYGGNVDELLSAAQRLHELPTVYAVESFRGEFRDYVNLKRMTSELVGRYVGAILTATRASGNGQGFGREHGTLVVPAEVRAEVTLLKTLAVLYVMDEKHHLSQQEHQRNRIFRVFEFLESGGRDALDPLYYYWWDRAETPQERSRVLIDMIASSTETSLERFDKRASEMSLFLA